MNDRPPLPNEPEQRFEEIEQRLRAFKPRAPRLDLAAIEQAVSDHADLVILPQRHTRRPGPWMSVIAGSWACGAVAGALTMFVILSSGVSRGTTGDNNPVPRTARKSHTTPASPGTVEASPKAVLARDFDEGERAQSLVFAAMLDSRDSSFGNERYVLRAGSYLRGFSPRREHGAVPKFDLSQGTTLETTSPSIPRPQPLTTRQTLLRELLNNDQHSIL